MMITSDLALRGLFSLHALVLSSSWVDIVSSLAWHKARSCLEDVQRVVLRWAVSVCGDDGYVIICTRCAHHFERSRVFPSLGSGGVNRSSSSTTWLMACPSTQKLTLLLPKWIHLHTKCSCRTFRFPHRRREAGW